MEQGEHGGAVPTGDGGRGPVGGAASFGAGEEERDHQTDAASCCSEKGISSRHSAVRERLLYLFSFKEKRGDTAPHTPQQQPRRRQDDEDDATEAAGDDRAIIRGNGGGAWMVVVSYWRCRYLREEIARREEQRRTTRTAPTAAIAPRGRT